VATYTENTMSPEVRHLLPDLGVERAVGHRDAEKTLLRYKLMKLGTELLELDIAIARAEHGPRDVGERELQELRARVPSPGLSYHGLQVGRPIVAVR
jgi:hypothetical protein